VAKYYDIITEETNLSRNIGAGLVVTAEFRVMSSIILSQCTFAQGLIQQIIYTSHGDQLIDAKRALREFPNPKARFDFLCNFPYSDTDPIIDKAFQFARNLFREIYEFRNVLAHENWGSSVQHPDAVLLSGLDEESRLLIASGRLWYVEETTPQQIYDASVRFIRNVKVVTTDHLNAAIRDAELCGWILMNINNVLDESDTGRKEEARKAFLVYGGTSHFFDSPADASETAAYSSSKSKTITGP
jgi:hypothetical protein